MTLNGGQQNPLVGTTYAGNVTLRTATCLTGQAGGPESPVDFVDVPAPITGGSIPVPNRADRKKTDSKATIEGADPAKLKAASEDTKADPDTAADALRKSKVKVRP